MPIIALGCGNRVVQNFRADTLSEYIKTLSYSEKINVILSGGYTGGKTVSEAELYRQRLEERGIPENISLFKEEKSTDTAKNLRYSFLEILDNNIPISDNIEIFTNAFHAERTRDFAEYIRDEEFPELKKVKFSIISAEEFATRAARQELVDHVSWKRLIEKFSA